MLTPDKHELQTEVIGYVSRMEDLTQTDIYNLDACLKALRKDLSPESLEVIDKCIQGIRERLSGFTELELEFFNRYK